MPSETRGKIEGYLMLYSFFKKIKQFVASEDQIISAAKLYFLSLFFLIKNLKCIANGLNLKILYKWLTIYS